MIGNDIIDLKIAGSNSRWRETRFLDALFTKEEQCFVLKDEFRFQNIWLLWSMKESAYKIGSRRFKLPKFNPKYFNCNVTSERSGTVSFGDQIVKTITEVNSNIIYTTAQFQKDIQFTEYSILEGQSKVEKGQHLKAKAIQSFCDLKSVSKSSVSIEKNEFGVPQFFIHDSLQDNCLTLTHHGSYGAFAISC